MCIILVENNENCETCVHFYQHYIQSGQYFKPIYCGHCVRPRIKIRKPDQHCPNWTPKQR